MADIGTVAIITARGGSKRLPGKNVLPLAGVPLLAWSVNAAVAYGDFAHIIISSDSDQYCDLALAHGATRAIKRSVELSSDSATSFDVVSDVLERERQAGRDWTQFVLLQPTSPFRNAQDISQAMSLFDSRRPEAVVSVCETECPVEWTGRLDPDLGMSEFTAYAKSNRRTQDLPRSYRLNGAIYCLNVEAFETQRTFVPTGALAYAMPRSRSIDVDTEEDFAIAQFLASRMPVPA